MVQADQAATLLFTSRGLGGAGAGAVGGGGIRPSLFRIILEGGERERERENETERERERERGEKENERE